jgi:hypothetical protein
LAPPLADVLNHWRARGGEDLACPWSKFQMHLLPPQVLPTTLVIDVFDDMERNRYRFWGSRMTVIHGKDMTGRSPYDLSPPDFAEDLRIQHREICETRAAGADLLGFQHERGFTQSHTILRLPLADDGRSVSHIVGVIWYSPETLKRLEQNGKGRWFGP